MKLDGAVLADIFLGKIKRWNEPAIAALNPGITLPDTRITVVHHSDGSGTTFNFSNYLSKVSPEWKAKVGEGTSLQWPSGIGGKGNEGVSAYVRQITGGIGYVEYAYALQNKLAYSRLENSAGKFVLADDKAFAAAAASADWSSAKDFNLIMTNAPGDEAWPITATTWAIMYKRSKKPAQTRAALDFFKWSFEQGQPQAASLDYVPLPPALVQKIEAYWAQNLK
jgi:phosphate transport system substrate-binding protein